jgi:hypothetical protein
MKHLSAFLGVFLLVTAAQAQGTGHAANMIHARGIYHPDGSRTESVKDPETKVLTETTYDARGVVIAKHIYQLNDQGQVMQGNIYDGRENLVARSQSYFDEFGRVKESRLMNLQGEVFQQTIYEYGADGKAKKPKVVNFNVRAPTMRPAVVDFTGTTPPPDGGKPVGLPSQGTATTPPAEEKSKKSFFGRLFQKKEKK